MPITSSAFTVEARQRVIFGDTDKMGVVYYANYLRYFELARLEYLVARGSTYTALEKQGYGLPVVEALVRYRAPARYEDMLLIRARVNLLKRASLGFDYEVLREGDRALLCTGSTLHACVGPSGKPERIPDALWMLLAEPTGVA